MAEAVAVVGVVASIVQLVDFGSKVLHRLSDFQSSVGNVPKAFQDVKVELPILLETLKETESSVRSQPLGEDKKQAVLLVVQRCHDQIALLDELVKKALPTETDSWRAKAGKAILSVRRDAKVAKINTNIRTNIQTLIHYKVATLSAAKVHPTHAKPTPSSTVPFRRDKDFVYREVLSQIQTKCSQPAARAALIGLGGVGKSQLAIEYSYRIRNQSPSTWVFWVHASSVARFKESYREIAEQMKIDGWGDPEADILRLVYNWLRDEANGQWLMIVDNADDANLFIHPTRRPLDSNQSSQAVSTEVVLEFLPQSQNGAILITSRSRDVAYAITGDANGLITVNPMDESLAIDLLQKKLSANFAEEDAKKLVEALDYMPLAVSQAAAYIGRAPHANISKYLQDLKRSDSDRTRLLSKHMSDARRDGKASNSIIATWHISFESIRRERPSAARLLSLLCLFDRQGIPTSILDGTYIEEGQEGDLEEGQEGDFEEDIYTLCSYSLVGSNVDGTELEMHRLVQFSTRTWLEMRSELENWRETLISIMNKEFPIGRYENWAVCQRLYPHVEGALEHRPTNRECLLLWASVAFNVAWFANEQGNYKLAERLNKQATDVFEKEYGSEDSRTLNSMANQASTYSDQGRWKEAEELEMQVMETTKRILGLEHPSTLTSIANLALTFWSQGRCKEAEELGKQAIEIRKNVLGLDHPSTLTSMGNLASIYQDQGRWKEAEELNIQVLETRKKVLGLEHPSTLTSMGNLALMYRNQGRWKEAEELNIQVLETRKKVLGLEHPDTLTSMGNLASTYRNQGRWKEAEELDVQVVETSSRVLGSEHPDTLSSIASLASTFWNQGRWKESEELGMQVMETSLRVLGSEHPDTLISMSDLASTFWNQGRWKEAEELEVKVMETSLRVLGSEHRDTLNSMANLASTFSGQGRWKEAEKLEVQVMETRKRIHGLEHPSTLTVMANLASTYRNQGRWKEAEELDAQVMETTTRVLGPEHPDTLTIMANLASTWKAQGRDTDAFRLMEQCVQLQVRILGAEHPHTRSSAAVLVEWRGDDLDSITSGVEAL